tara:strand:- start:12 stop:455 length:444 start_codon:yes stop_codon:yes gene_type:complete
MKELVGEECFQILDNKEYILFYFGASWCKPCQEILPSMEDLIREYDQKIIQFYKIDIDNKENKLICEKCKIKVVPSFLLFKERTFINRTKGNNIHSIREMINSVFFPDEQITPIEQEKEVEEEKKVEGKKDPFTLNKEIFNKKRLFK